MLLPVKSYTSKMSIQTQLVGDHTPFTEEFQAYVEELRQHFHVPSISIGVINGDKCYLQVNPAYKPTLRVA